MRIRAKVLTVATAMVTTFAILPTFGAAAADTLEDGTYEIAIDAATYTVEVIDGAPVVDELEGVEFHFAFDDETSRVLDEFGLIIDDIAYEVEVADDGTVEVTRDDDASEDDDSEDDDLDESNESDDLDGLDDVDEVDEDDDLISVEDTDGDELADGTVSGAHGELVSTVAQCAPAGIEAREAGLPNHGFFVSAAAHGDSVDFELDGASHTADFSSLEGAEEFCILADELLESGDENSTSGDDVIVTLDEDEETDDTDDGTDEADDTEDTADGTDGADGADEADETHDGTEDSDDGTDDSSDDTDDGSDDTDDGAEDTEDADAEAGERASESRGSSGRDG